MMEHERVILDIDSQRGFFPSGADHCNSSAARAGMNISSLIHWAGKSYTPVISTVLRLRVHDVPPRPSLAEFVEGSDAERKISDTLLANRMDFGIRNITDLPEDVFDLYDQVIFEKRHPNIFAHARLDRLINQLRPCTFIICGAGKSISEAAIGLRSRRFGVVIVRDATVGVCEDPEELSVRKMDAKGVVFADMKDIVEPVKPQRTARPFRRKSAKAKV